MSNVIVPGNWSEEEKTVRDPERQEREKRTKGNEEALKGEPAVAAPAAQGVFLIGTRTGGQGKTMAAQLIVRAMRKSGVDLVLAAADTDRSGVKSKFGSVFAGVRELGIGADLDVALRDGSALVRHWDQVGEVLESPSAIVDIGANVIGDILRWGRGIGADTFSGADLTLVVPVTAQAQAVSDALEVIRDARKPGGLPFRRIVVIFNALRGDPAALAGASELERLADVVRIGVGPTFTIGWLDQNSKPISYFDGRYEGREVSTMWRRRWG